MKLDSYAKHEGQPYCVLHYPGEEKKQDFRNALDEKLRHGNSNFAAVYFPEDLSFESRKFGAEANFSKAIFKGDVDFSRASFEEKVNFDEATFHGEANYFEASFKRTARFVGATFDGAPFSGVQSSTGTRISLKPSS